MPQTLSNKSVVPVNSDAYNLAADLASLGSSLNVVIRVASQTERDALTKVAGLCVIRTDLPGAPLERCDGNAWYNTQHTEWTFSAPGVPHQQPWGCGTLTNDATQTTDTGFVTTATADRLTIRDPGTYAVSIVSAFGTATSGRSFFQIAIPGATSTNPNIRSSISTSEDTGSLTMPNLRLAANSSLIFTTYVTLGASNATTSWTGRVRITRIGY